MNTTASQQVREVCRARKPVYKGVSCVTAGPDGEDIDYFDTSAIHGFTGTVGGFTAMLELVNECQRTENYELMTEALEAIYTRGLQKNPEGIGFIAGLWALLEDVMEGVDLSALAKKHLGYYEESWASDIAAQRKNNDALLARLKGVSHA